MGIVGPSVVVLGNSNSIFKFGFTKALSDWVDDNNGDIKNISLGGSCLFFHIYQILTQRQLLEQADYIFIDTTVIDTAHFSKGLITKDYLVDAIQSLYALISSFDAIVIKVFFPVYTRVSDYKNNVVLSEHFNACAKFQIPYIDMYQMMQKLNNPRDAYGNVGHLNVRSAYRVGKMFCDIISSKTVDELGHLSTQVFDTPYVSVAISDPIFACLQKETLSNSYLTMETAILDREISISEYRGHDLIGFLTWNANYSASIAIKGNGKKNEILLRKEFATFDIIRDIPNLTDKSRLVPIQAIADPVQKNKSELELYPKIGGLLLRSTKTHLHYGSTKSGTEWVNPLLDLIKLDEVLNN